MSLVESLMEAARADTDLLGRLDAQGDDFSVPRDVDFLLLADSREKAELVRDFVNDYQYGAANSSEDGESHRIQVVVRRPIQRVSVHLKPRKSGRSSTALLVLNLA